MNKPSGYFQSLPRNVKLLGLVSFVNDVASEIIYPLFPHFFVNVLGGSKFALGVLEGLGESISSLLKLGAGIVSDRVGRRKPFMVVGYGIAGLGRPCLGIVSSVWGSFALRLFDRFGKGVRTAPRDATIADSTPMEMQGTAFGFHRAMDHAGATLGPLLAAGFLWFYPEQLRTLFLLTLIPGIILVLVVTLMIREPQVATVKTIGTGAIGIMPSSGGFRRYLPVRALFALGTVGDALLLLRLGELGLSTEWTPIVWAGFGLIKGVGNAYLGPLADRLGARRLMVGGWLLYAIVCIGLAYCANVVQAIALFTTYGLFYSLTEPAEKKLVVDLVELKERGSAFGWFHFALGVMALPAGMLFGWLYEDYGARWAFGTAAGLAIVSVGLFTLCMRPSPKVLHPL